MWNLKDKRKIIDGEGKKGESNTTARYCSLQNKA